MLSHLRDVVRHLSPGRVEDYGRLPQSELPVGPPSTVSTVTGTGRPSVERRTETTEYGVTRVDTCSKRLLPRRGVQVNTRDLVGGRGFS